MLAVIMGRAWEKGVARRRGVRVRPFGSVPLRVLSIALPCSRLPLATASAARGQPSRVFTSVLLPASSRMRRHSGWLSMAARCAAVYPYGMMMMW